tara:strand:+ start:2274 stop:3308 length:1035 start_codon:yes stop_codon:yes gene_type:complete
MKVDQKKVLVTGAAGFIGAALSLKLLEKGMSVIGIDNLNNYYDPELKKSRIKLIDDFANRNLFDWSFKQVGIEEKDKLNNIFRNFEPKIVVNLAAQAGVRYSLENPLAYINSNIVGFTNLLEASVSFGINNFIYASSSSVYGGNKKLPFNESDSVNHPISLYAATKISNELIAHCYSHLYDLPCTGLRFFTVYGPWGRPDMAPMIFAKAILNEEPIDIFNNGRMQRDFTFIDDVVEALLRCCQKPAFPDPVFNANYPEPFNSWAPYRVFNIGNSRSIDLMNFIEILEKAFGKKAIKKFKPLQPGDVINTNSNNSKLEQWINYKPTTNLEEGVLKFARWYKSYYC